MILKDYTASSTGRWNIKSAKNVTFKYFEKWNYLLCLVCLIQL